MIIYNNIGIEINIFEDSLINIWYCFDNGSTREIKILPLTKFKYERSEYRVYMSIWIFSFYKRKIRLNDN